MKLYSAATPEDLGNATTFVSNLADPKYWGYTDIVHHWGNAAAASSASLGKGLAIYGAYNGHGIMLRDIIDDYPTGDCWIAFGMMAEPFGTNAMPNNGGGLFTIGTSPAAQVSNGTLFPGCTCGQAFTTYGQGKRVAIETIFKPLTGEYRVYVNGVKRAEGTMTPFGNVITLRDACLNFCQYAAINNWFLLTDYYLGVVDSIDDRVGAFKVDALLSKQTTLPTGTLTMDGTSPTITGDHTVEYDVAPIQGKNVVGIVEQVRAASVGPTAALSFKRKVNGTETGARKVSDIPVTFPLKRAEILASSRVGAPATNYVKGTPLTEAKLSLSVQANN